MHTPRPPSPCPGRATTLCRVLGAGLLLSLFSACEAEQDAEFTAADEAELDSALKGFFGEGDRRPDRNACIEGTLESRACIPEGGWRERIETACRAFGGKIERFAVDGDCRGGGFHGARFRCCPAAPPPPPPPPPECRRRMLHTDACHSAESWKEMGARACHLEGLVLGDLGFEHKCDDGNYDAAAIVCCRPDRPPPPPPPPPMCEGLAQGGPTSCKSEALWKEHAAQDCASRGLRLGEQGFAERCGEGQYRLTKYTCCK